MTACKWAGSNRRRVTVLRDTDGTWSAIWGNADDDSALFPDDWIAEGVGSWERAMHYACDALGGRYA